MRLTAFRVQNFRSIKDTDWVSVDDWACLVGPNEAGKSNILRALHRLNPENDSVSFVLDDDCPHEKLPQVSNSDYSEIAFVYGLFKLNAADKAKIHEIMVTSPVSLTEARAEDFIQSCQFVEIKRRFNNGFGMRFYTEHPDKIIAFPLNQVMFDEVQKKIIPRFCYYNEFGTLDAEINLPESMERVIDIFSNPEKASLVTAEDHLLDIFLQRLDPNLQLLLQASRATGKDERKRHKKQRDTILNSQANSLSKKFNKQWQAGDYIFDFDVDGDDLTIFVSDDKRPEKILLSARGAGMQAFFSLLLLCEHQNSTDSTHKILLFDEPGAHLHPNAQQDFSRYFTEFLQQQQLIYTTHSPFMIDHNHIDRVKATYVGEDGYTAISNNLSRPLDKHQAAFLPLYAALDISISETLFLGCDVLLVEGVSDQIYLLAIKQRLLRQNTWKRNKELIIIPVKGAPKMIYHVSLLAGRGHLPLILLDSDKSGEASKEALKDRFYENPEDHILQVGEFCQNNNAEIEDLFSLETIVSAVNQLYKLPDDKSINANAVLPNEAVMPQIKKILYDQGIKDFGKRKVEIAELVKQNIEKDDDFPEQEAWQNLFAAIDDKLENPKDKASKRSG